MSIAPEILREYPDLNSAQKEIVGHLEGPLLAIAGPGSGKTFSLVLRTMNLLALEMARPKEIILCTFTEKAAFELRDRIASAARKVGYLQDITELRVSTIHGLCNSLLQQYRHHTPLGNSYETLDQLTQLLFIFDHFGDIVGSDHDGQYLEKWTTRWTAIHGASGYFDKITEELVDPERMLSSTRPFVRSIGTAYLAYQKSLQQQNKTDFAMLQKYVHALLQDESIGPNVQKDIKYVMVDEYQDTNFIQEQLLLKLVERTENLTVVGDEDQSLYRFRGATVRNILEFPSRFPGCKIVKLTVNYRSHRRIVEAYDRWMATADWSNRDGTNFRFDKSITADLKTDHADYPAILKVWTTTAADEADRVANFVKYLMDTKVVSDPSQVAILLHSVRDEHSAHYVAALEQQGISTYCPRARTYFENEEVELMLACFSLIFGWYDSGRGETRGSVSRLACYVDECLVKLARRYGGETSLSKLLKSLAHDVAQLTPGGSLDLRPADYFYRLIAIEPFSTFVKNENRARNLSILSQLLNVFQNYYHYTFVNHRNREYLRFHLFNSFFRLLYDGGINEYEDPDEPFPKGHVHIMTIHQAKGLEFPVVIVGSLDKRLSSPKQIDRDLEKYYHRAPFEPENRITEFDRMRLHYVAFSRPEKILVLTSHRKPKGYFESIWEGLPQWPYVEQELLAAQSFELRKRIPVKRAYSFTGDLKIYETCPRQYQFFREYDFTPSRSAVIFFGLLVHQTIEEIHRIVMDGSDTSLSPNRIKELFDKTFYFLTLSDVRPIGKAAREAAFQQVVNYHDQNQDEMHRVVETEVDVSVEKDDYILNGKVDLLLGNDGQLELLDFKTSPRPVESPELLASYERQLCTYAHILQRRHGKHVSRMMLYWTAEPNKQDALMQFPFSPDVVDEAGTYFDGVVKRIQSRDFHVRQLPETGICKECDMRWYCLNDGLLVRGTP